MRRCLVISITFVILSSVFTLIHLQARFYSTSFADQTAVGKSFTIDSEHNYGSNSDIYSSNAMSETENASSVDQQQFKIISLDSPAAQKVKEFSKNQWPVKNLAFSDKVTPEYIQQLKNTKQCKRMVIQNA